MAVFKAVRVRQHGGLGLRF